MTGRALAMLPAAMLFTAAAGAAVLCESWGGKDSACTHPSALAVSTSGGQTVLSFDLSKLPAGATAHHASLHCFTKGDVQPATPVRILAGGTALTLESPYYHSFDATAAVRGWAGNPAQGGKFVVERFDQFNASRSVLEIRFESQGDKRPAQVEGLKAVHHDGQTFLVWNEISSFSVPADKIVWIERIGALWQNCSVAPAGYGKGDTVLAKEGGRNAGGQPRVAAIRLADYLKLRKVRIANLPPGPKEALKYAPTESAADVRYRVYRHDKPITAENVSQAQRVGESLPLSIYHPEVDARAVAGDDPLNRNVVITYRIGPDTPLLPGQAYYVHTVGQGSPEAASESGAAFYAVTVVADGTENLSEIGAGNSLDAPVMETPAEAKPVLQFVKPGSLWTGGVATDSWYAYWLAPPCSNLPQPEPRLIGVSVGTKYKAPGPMDFRADAGRFGPILLMLDDGIQVYIGREGRNRNSLGYNAGLGTLRAAGECPVDYFIERYLASVTRWAIAEFKADPARVSSFTTGYFALRHPELFGLAIPGYLDRGIFTTWEIHMNNRWNPDSMFMETDLGPADIARTTDGHKAWDVFSVEWYLRQYPERDIPFFACSHICARDSGDGAEQGWQDEPGGFAALRDARQPFAAVWACGHEAEWRQTMRAMHWDRSVPAFSNCSLDNNPGTGDADSGEPWGQINGYLLWDYGSVVDEADRWEMTVYLIAASPENFCTVDVTPRHRKNFNPKAGAKFAWTNTSVVAAGKPAESGEVATDQWGLVTLKQITVGKGKNRIVVVKQ